MTFLSQILKINCIVQCDEARSAEGPVALLRGGQGARQVTHSMPWVSVLPLAELFDPSPQ